MLAPIRLEITTTVFEIIDILMLARFVQKNSNYKTTFETQIRVENNFMHSAFAVIKKNKYYVFFTCITINTK